MRRLPYYYILDAAGNPIPEPDLTRWAQWMQTADRHVAQDILGCGIRVSTVFLAFDHDFLGGDPLLWETLVFGGPMHGQMKRYISRADAERGHAAMVAAVRAGGLPESET